MFLCTQYSHASNHQPSLGWGQVCGMGVKLKNVFAGHGMNCSDLQRKPCLPPTTCINHHAMGGCGDYGSILKKIVARNCIKCSDPQRKVMPANHHPMAVGWISSCSLLGIAWNVLICSLKSCFQLPSSWSWEGWECRMISQTVCQHHPMGVGWQREGQFQNNSCLGTASNVLICTIWGVYANAPERRGLPQSCV